MIRKKNEIISKKQRENDLKPKKRGKFLDNEPNLLNILNRPGGIKKSKLHLKNGNICDSRPMVQRKRIRITNTCALDSLLEIISSACANYKTFNNFLRCAVNASKKANEKDLFQLALFYLENGVCKKTYDERGEFCFQYYHHNKPVRWGFHVKATQSDF